MRRILIAVSTLIVTGMLLATHAYATGVLIGPFWLDGVRAEAHPEDYYDKGEGRWTRTDYEYHIEDPAFPGQAHLTVFKKSVQLDGPSTPARVQAAVAAQHIETLLSGGIRNLKLTVYTLRASGAQRVWILAPVPGQSPPLDAELGYVTSGLQKIIGGTMDLKGSRLWVKNLTDFASGPEGSSGEFELTTWNRTLRGARVAFKGGATGTTTLMPVGPEQNIVLHVDMGSGEAKLWDALLSSEKTQQPVALQGDSIAIGPASLTTPVLESKVVVVAAKSGALTAQLDRVAGRAQSLSLPMGTAQLGGQQLSIACELGKSSGVQSTDIASFEALNVSGCKSEVQQAALSQGGQSLITGTLHADNASLSTVDLDVPVQWLGPHVPPLEFLTADGDIQQVSMQFKGQWAQRIEMLSGSLDTKSLKVGHIKLIRALHLSFPRSALDTEFTVPISIDVGQHGGQIEISDGSQTAIIGGALNRLLVNAILSVSLFNLPVSHLDVPKDKLQLEIAAAISTSPWFGSTKPDFASASVGLHNYTPLFVTTSKSTGLVILDATALVVADPVIQMGGSSPFRARTTLEAAAHAGFGYCLNRGDLQLVKGSFRARDAAFRALDPGGIVNLGGTYITDPDGSIQSLAFDIDVAAHHGQMSSGAVQMNGSHISRAQDAQKNDIAFDGTLTQPLTVASLGGTPDVSGTKISFTNLEANTVAVGVSGFRFDIGSAISLSNAGMLFGASKVVSSVELTSTNSDTPTPVAPRYMNVQSLEDICAPDPPPEKEPDKTTREYVTALSISGVGSLRLDGDVGGDPNNEVNVHLANQPSLAFSNVSLSGRTDKLNGSGDVQFSGFVGSVKSGILTDAGCDGGAFLRIPVQTSVATGGSKMKLTFSEGKSESKGDFAGFVMNMTSTGESECAGAWHKQTIIAAGHGWTDGICPTWSEPFRHCRWEWDTPEVSYEYRSKAVVRLLTTTFGMTNPYVQFGGSKTLMCNVGPAAVIPPTLIIGGYYPEFRGNIPVVSQVANVFVGLTAEAAESGIATALGSFLLNLATGLLGSPVGAAACVPMGFWS